MPCFSCKCFSDGQGRYGEPIEGGRGYCELWDQEYWRGHECGDFAPVWYYSSQTSRPATQKPRGEGFWGFLQRTLSEPEAEADALEYEEFDEPEEDLAYEEFDEDDFDSYEEDPACPEDVIVPHEGKDDCFEIALAAAEAEARAAWDDLDRAQQELDAVNLELTVAEAEARAARENLSRILRDFEDAGGEQPVSQPSKRLTTVQKNITLDDAVFRKYGVVFKYHLVEECDTLQLNFELNNTRKLVPKMDRDEVFYIKANVYDAMGRLLCLEEEWVEYRQLKSDYAAGYFFFSSDNMDKAHSIRIYAIDPSDDDEEVEEYSVVSKNPPSTRQFLPDETLVGRFNEILSDSLRLMKTTVDPKTFFGRYEDALSNAKKIAEITHVAGHKAFAREVVSDLTAHRKDKVKAFIDRCNAQGKLYTVKDELLSGQYDIPTDLTAYVEDLVREIEATPAEAPESGEYIYCSLSFGSAGKTYYYKTTDESLQCGDEVIVRVGKAGRKGIATIEKIERFAAGETPYPPNLTKDILGKCPY